MKYRKTIIHGNGIGPEVSNAAQRVLEAAVTVLLTEWMQLTPDMGSSSTTTELIDALIREAVR